MVITIAILAGASMTTGLIGALKSIKDEHDKSIRKD